MTTTLDNVIQDLASGGEVTEETEAHSKLHTNS